MTRERDHEGLLNLRNRIHYFDPPRICHLGLELVLVLESENGIKLNQNCAYRTGRRVFCMVWDAPSRW